MSRRKSPKRGGGRGDRKKGRVFRFVASLLPLGVLFGASACTAGHLIENRALKKAGCNLQENKKLRSRWTEVSVERGLSPKQETQPTTTAVQAG